VYLASAREHPPAVAVRQQQRDVALTVHFIRDFSRRQSELFLLVADFLKRYEPADFQSIVDDDVNAAASALASTFETASRGVIYDHRPASLPAERLVAALKPLLQEAGKNGGTAFERDAAVVLRRVAEAVGDARAADVGNRRAFLDLVGRVIRRGNQETADESDRNTPRLIVP
jgi:hypothetical protein